MKKYLLIGILLILSQTYLIGQSLEKEWQFSSVENELGEPLFNINPSTDLLILSEGNFQYQLEAKDNLQASGTYSILNNELVFYYTQPTDTIRNYKITEHSDATLVFTENNVLYKFKSISEITEVVPVTSKESDAIIPSQGLSAKSIWRGILGMISLLFIAFLFSSNKKAINWRTVGIGLAFQLIIAIGVLKVSIVQKAFEGVGKVFVSILDFTRAGSKFLFEGLVVDMDTFGFIFAFQVLPTIIFFSALTSVLFYLGIIQKVVKAFGWLLSKLLQISGAESLSVAGNIFLGQTEAPLLIKEYLEKMNKSEMLLVMIGGMATVAGAVLSCLYWFFRW